MKVPFEYRSYIIDREDGWYIAKPMDGESCEIGSRRLFRVMRAVDALWDALEDGVSPSWLAASGSVDLDRPARDRIQIMTPFLKWPLRNTIESAASETGPPRGWKTALMISSAIGLAIPIAMAAHQYVSGLEPEIVFTLIVMLIALVCGAAQALVASFIFAAIFNFAFEAPSLAFTSPGADELIYLIINVTLSIGLPWLFPRRKPVMPWGKSGSDRIRDTA